MRRFALVAASAIAALAIVLAGCGGMQARTEIGTVSSGLQITAHDLAFDRTELDVPANAAFDLVFDNRDSLVPHNVSVYTDSSASTSVFIGDVVGGPGAMTYHLPALKPGTYFFRCDLHTEMNGTLVAKP